MIFFKQTLFGFLLIISFHICEARKFRPRGEFNIVNIYRFRASNSLAKFIACKIKKSIDGTSYYYYIKENRKFIYAIDCTLFDDADIIKRLSKRRLSKMIYRNHALVLDRVESSLELINDSVYQELEEYDKLKFYQKYIDKNGGLQNCDRLEVRKAVIYYLLVNHISVGIADISGDPVVPKYILTCN